jgi:iron(III) transport system substrate-binding protein
VKQVLSELQAKADAGREDEGIDKDLFFGGGDYEHNKLAAGVTVKRGGKMVAVSAGVPADIPDDIFKAAFPTPDIAGARLYHPQKYWFGAALSSFGIVYNRDALRLLGLPEPQTWADLQDPRYCNWVALADAAHSGSIGVTYDTILRRLGWQPGWRVLRRCFANSRYFTDSATKVPIDVSASEAAAGMCIDFYGRFQAGAIGGQRIGYVDPDGMTAITSDPICILRGAPSQRRAAAAGKSFREGLANQFVIWLLGREAQGLWQRKAGVPGGPAKFELRRLPIRRDMYGDAAETAAWTDHVDPFRIAKPFPPEVPSFLTMVAPLSHAMAIDIHDDLSAAWRAGSDHPDHPRHEQMIRLFEALPPELTEVWPVGWSEELHRDWSRILRDPSNPHYAEVAGVPAQTVMGVMVAWSRDPDRKIADRVRWTKFFQEQYRQAVLLANHP